MNESNKRKIEITIETHSLTIIRVRGGVGSTASAFCEICCRHVQFFTLAHTALIFRINPEFIESLFSSNQIHKVSGNAVCAISLADHFKQELRFVED